MNCLEAMGFSSFLRVGDYGSRKIGKRNYSKYCKRGFGSDCEAKEGVGESWDKEL